jgi:hypothetical protein
MRLMLRWGVAVAMSAAGFALSWWVCQKLIGLDEGVSLAIAGAVLAVVLAVGGWWAIRAPTAGALVAVGGGLCRRPGRAGTSTWPGGT